MQLSRSISAACLGLAIAAVSALAASPLAAPEADGRSALFRPAAERASILEVLRGARASIRSTVRDLGALHAYDPAAPPDGSIVDALIEKAREGVDVKVIVEPGGAPQELLDELAAASVQVHESDDPFEADAETFLVDDRVALILSTDLLPGAGHARDYAIETTERWLVARLATDFDSAFASPEGDDEGDDSALDRFDAPDDPPQDRFSPSALPRRQAA